MLVLYLVKVTQSCPTLCGPMDCGPPGSSVHEILQVRILEWEAIPFSRGSSQPRDQTQVSHIVGVLYIFAEKALEDYEHQIDCLEVIAVSYFKVVKIFLKAVWTEVDEIPLQVVRVCVLVTQSYLTSLQPHEL